MSIKTLKNIEFSNIFSYNISIESKRINLKGMKEICIEIKTVENLQ
jgi:hypothetical protein